MQSYFRIRFYLHKIGTLLQVYYINPYKIPNFISIKSQPKITPAYCSPAHQSWCLGSNLAGNIGFQRVAGTHRPLVQLTRENRTTRKRIYHCQIKFILLLFTSLPTDCYHVGGRKCKCIKQHTERYRSSRPYDLFEPVTEKERNKWELPTQLAHYYNKHTRMFIPERV